MRTDVSPRPYGPPPFRQGGRTKEGAWMRRMRQKVRAWTIGIVAAISVGLVREEILGYLILIGAVGWLIGKILEERERA